MQNTDAKSDRLAEQQTSNPISDKDRKPDEEDLNTAEAPDMSESLAALEEEVVKMRDQWMRAAADLENVRKRAARERAAARREERKRVLEPILEVADSLERALTAQGDDGTDWRAGVEAVHQQLIEALAKSGVRPVATEGVAFDPERHEAMRMVEDSPHEAGTIVETYQTGFEMEDGTPLRPARVAVAR